MKRRQLFLLALAPCALIPISSSGAVRGDEVMYVGGTLTQIPDRTEGRLNVEAADVAVFNSKKGSFSVAYDKVTSLEYGQKAGRRVGVALVVNPLFLFSKKRKHFLTIGFTDSEGQAQGAVLEIGKKHVRPVLSLLETKTGKTVEYESEEARKHAGN